MESHIDHAPYDLAFISTITLYFFHLCLYLLRMHLLFRLYSFAVFCIHGNSFDCLPVIWIIFNFGYYKCC